MPDSPLERAAAGPYDRGMEQRVTRLEDAMRDNTAAIARIDVAVAEMRGVFPSLATKAELAQLATKAELAQQIGQLATKAELAQQTGQLATKVEVAQLSTKAEVGEIKLSIAQLATKAEVGEIKLSIAQLATKAEVTEIKLEIAGLNARMDHQMATKSDVALLREDIAELRGYVKGLPTTWIMVTAIVAGQVGITGVIAGALLAAVRMFVHT